jgi:hypothetical protein
VPVMPWAKLDDGFYDDPKVRRAGLAASGLFCRALAYSARHLTDGYVDQQWIDEQTATLRPGERRQLVESLIGVGLWERRNGGYVARNYLKFNPSRADVEARRESDRKRKGNPA